MSQALGKGKKKRKRLRVNTRAAQVPWGRAGNLIKQMYCVWGDRSMWLPPDAMHFHSGTSCCAVQSELRPEVSLFISSVAETKEQWERRRESGGEQIIIPGDSAHKISRKAYMFFRVVGVSTYYLVATEDTYYPGNVHTCRMLLVLPSRSSAAHSPGWCRWAAPAAATTGWSCSWWSWSGAWWERWRELRSEWERANKTMSEVNDKKMLVLRMNSWASQNSITGNRQAAQLRLRQKTTAAVPVSRSPDQETDQSQQQRRVNFSLKVKLVI